MSKPLLDPHHSRRIVHARHASSKISLSLSLSFALFRSFSLFFVSLSVSFGAGVFLDGTLQARWRRDTQTHIEMHRNERRFLVDWDEFSTTMCETSPLSSYATSSTWQSGLICGTLGGVAGTLAGQVVYLSLFPGFFFPLFFVFVFVAVGFVISRNVISLFLLAFGVSE